MIHISTLAGYEGSKQCADHWNTKILRSPTTFVVASESVETESPSSFEATA